MWWVSWLYGWVGKGSVFGREWREGEIDCKIV
jgi:hypothetical protein